MNRNRSIQAWQQACGVIPGGVNSPVRAFKSVGGNPLFIKKAKGAYIWDIDDNQYIDFVASWGPMILGHAHEEVLEAIAKAAENGTSYGAPTLAETAMAEQIIRMVPSIEKVRMVNSGTEATMSAIRLARGYTGRELIVKFAGCYHGHGDSFLIKAGSGAITLGLPDSPGVTSSTAKDTLIAEYNHLESVETLFRQYPDRIAAVIVEPVAGNMGVVPPVNGFLEGLRKITTHHGAILIFDEVITGFRLAPGGAQQHYQVNPDLTTLGKIIGGGLPVGAYGGKAEIMDCLAPLGPVYQAGTLSGNPLAMSAGLAVLTKLSESPSVYQELETKSATVEEGLRQNAREAGIPLVINRVGSMITGFYTSLPCVQTYDHAMSSDTRFYAKVFWLSLENGIYQAPSQFECMFISLAHSSIDIEQFLSKNRLALKNASI